MRLIKPLLLVLFGFLLHAATLEGYLILHFKHMDECPPDALVVRSDHTVDPTDAYGDCRLKVDMEEPPLIVSFQLFKFYPYKTVSFK